MGIRSVQQVEKVALRKIVYRQEDPFGPEHPPVIDVRKASPHMLPLVDFLEKDRIRFITPATKGHKGISDPVCHPERSEESIFNLDNALWILRFA